MSTADKLSIKPIGRLTKADTRALWHAINNAGYMVRELTTNPGTESPEVVQAEKALLDQAKRALRKVNALRKAGL